MSDDKIPTTSRPMRALPDLRYIEMGPIVRVLQQAWVPADGYGGMVEWRDVPAVSRKEAGYAE